MALDLQEPNLVNPSSPSPAAGPTATVRRPVVYVAGPYRDPAGPYFVERNIRRAERVAQELWLRQMAAICPHLNTKHFDGLCPAETWLEGDLQILERCDGMVVLPDWTASQGTRRELVHAHAARLPIYFVQSPALDGREFDAPAFLRFQDDLKNRSPALRDRKIQELRQVIDVLMVLAGVAEGVVPIAAACAFLKQDPRFLDEALATVAQAGFTIAANGPSARPFDSVAPS